MQEVRHVQRCKLLDGLECHGKDFVADPELDGEPVELLQDGSVMVDGRSQV